MTPAELRDHIPSTPGTYSDTLKNVPSLSVRMDKSQLTVINDLFLILWMNDEKTETEKLGEDQTVSDVYYSAKRLQFVSHQHTAR